MSISAMESIDFCRITMLSVVNQNLISLDSKKATLGNPTQNIPYTVKDPRRITATLQTCYLLQTPLKMYLDGRVLTSHLKIYFPQGKMEEK